MRWTQCERVLEVKARLDAAVAAHTRTQEKKKMKKENKKERQAALSLSSTVVG